MSNFSLKKSSEQIELDLKDVINLQSAIEIYLSTTQTKATTYHTYSRSLARFKLWADEKRIDFLQIDTAKMLEYKSYLVDVLEFKEATISTYLTSVRRFYEFLLEHNKVDSNPVRAVKGGKRPQKHSTKYLTKTQIEQLFNFILSEETELAKRDAMIFKLMLNAGLGEMEISELKFGDVKKDKNNFLLYVKTKGETKKVGIPITQEFFDELLVFLGETENTISLAEKSDFPVIKNLHLISDKPLTVSIRALRRRVDFYLEQTGLKQNGIKALSFRHTAAILALERGMPVEEVKTFMRHKMLDTTMIYQNSQLWGKLY